MPRKRKQTADMKKRLAATRRKQETPEQRAVRLEKCRIRAAIKRANETEEERAARLARHRTQTYSTRHNLKKQARSINLQYILNKTSKFSDNTNPPDLSYKEKAAFRAYLLLETQRAAAARNAADRRNRETFEQRTARLEKCRIRSAVSRACEDEESRAVRLARQRIRTNSARLKQRLADMESQKAKQQATNTDNNNIYVSHEKTAFNQSPYFNHTSLTAKEFRNRLLLQHFHQLQIGFNFNAHLGLQAMANQWQLDTNPSITWPRYDHLSLYLGNSMVDPSISPDEEEGKVIDEESNTSKSDVFVECEVTIEEENNCMVDPVFPKREPTEEGHPQFGCDTAAVKQEAVDEQENLNRDFSVALESFEQSKSLPAKVS